MACHFTEDKPTRPLDLALLLGTTLHFSHTTLLLSHRYTRHACIWRPLYLLFPFPSIACSPTPNVHMACFLTLSSLFKCLLSVRSSQAFSLSPSLLLLQSTYLPRKNTFYLVHLLGIFSIEMTVPWSRIFVYIVHLCIYWWCKKYLTVNQRYWSAIKDANCQQFVWLFPCIAAENLLWLDLLQVYIVATE